MKMKRLYSWKLSISLFVCFLFFKSSIFSQKIWLSTNSIDSFPVFCMSSIEGYLYAGMVKKGIYKTKDKGLTWTDCSAGIENLSPTQILKKGNFLFVSTLYHGVFASKDKGNSWTKTDTTIHQKVNALATKGNWLFAGTDLGLYRSNDNGNTWKKINHPYTSLLQRPIYSLLVVNDRLVAGSRRYLFLTNDDGDSWTITDVGSKGDIRVAKKFGNDIYLGSSADGVFKSSLNAFQETGGDWQPLTTELPDLNNIKAFVMKESSLHIAALTKGIYIGDILENTGLPTTLIGSLVTHKGILYAGTYWDGVWKYDMPPSPPLKVKPNTTLGLFPNPTNADEVTLSYEVLEVQTLSISILDNTGKELQNITKTHDYKGSYQERIDISNLQTGTYYCTIRDKNGSKTEKLVLIK